MKSFPMCAEMVRAFRDGSKTLTSRGDGLAWLNVHPDWWSVPARDSETAEWSVIGTLTGKTDIVKPRFSPRDRFYVREAWATGIGWDKTRPSRLLSCLRADDLWWQAVGLPKGEQFGRTRPGMFLPERLARTFGVVTSVTLKRVQEITEDEARAEGVPWLMVPLAEDGDPLSSMRSHGHRVGYSRTIDRLYGAGTWDANPWRWFYGIERMERP